MFIELGHKRKCKRTGALMDILHSNFSKNLHINALEIFWESIYIQYYQVKRYEFHCAVFKILLLVMHIPRFLTLNLSSFEKQ